MVRHICLILISDINTKTAFYPLCNGDGSKTAKIIKKVILSTITSPEGQRDAE